MKSTAIFALCGVSTANLIAPRYLESPGNPDLTIAERCSKMAPDLTDSREICRKAGEECARDANGVLTDSFLKPCFPDSVAKFYYEQEYFAASFCKTGRENKIFKKAFDLMHTPTNDTVIKECSLFQHIIEEGIAGILPRKSNGGGWTFEDRKEGPTKFAQAFCQFLRKLDEDNLLRKPDQGKILKKGDQGKIDQGKPFGKPGQGTSGKFVKGNGKKCEDSIVKLLLLMDNVPKGDSTMSVSHSP